MKTLYPVPPDPSTDPVYLAAAAVQSLIHPLPSGTAFCIGVVLIVMMTGRLVQTKGSLARAVLPFVVHLRWGWHRVERAMERGTFSLDAMFDRAADWCLAHLPIEPYGWAVSTARSTPSTRRLLPVCGRAALGLGGQRRLPSGWPGRAGQYRGRLDRGRDDSWGACGPGAPHPFWPQLPRGGGARLRGFAPRPGKRLLVVDAGIATQEQFAAATEQDALMAFR